MIIEHIGHSCIRVITKPGLSGEVTVVFDPFDNSIGLKLPRLTADVVAVTHDHHDHSYTDGVNGDYFLINSAGEYEVKETFFYGIPGWHDDKKGTERGAITMYLMESEGMSLAHLGDIGQSELTTEQMEHLEGADILLIPVGGTYTVNAKQAAAIVAQVEPRIVIPIHYHVPGLKLSKNIDTVDAFVKETGLKPETMSKLKLAKKDLPQEETKLIILSD